MSERVYVSGDRLIISQAGYDASPSLADANKIFDSSWLFAGSIILSGIYLWPADGNPRTIALPQTMPEPPAVYMLSCLPPGYYVSPDYDGGSNKYISYLGLSLGVAGGYATTAGVVLPGMTSGRVFLNSSDASNLSNPHNAALVTVFGM